MTGAGSRRSGGRGRWPGRGPCGCVARGGRGRRGGHRDRGRAGRRGDRRRRAALAARTAVSPRARTSARVARAASRTAGSGTAPRRTRASWSRRASASPAATAARSSRRRRNVVPGRRSRGRRCAGRVALTGRSSRWAGRGSPTRPAALSRGSSPQTSSAPDDRVDRDHPVMGQRDDGRGFEGGQERSSSGRCPPGRSSSRTCGRARR